MSTPTQPTPGIKIRIFRFLQLSWTQILTGELTLDPKGRKLKISYQNNSNDHLIPQCTPSLVQGSQQCKYITVDFSRLSKIQQDESDRKIVYIWIDVNPFSFSFLSQTKATQICQYLQILQQSIQINDDQQDNNQVVTGDYINHWLENNAGMISTLFINSKRETIQTIIEAVRDNVKEHEDLSEENKESCFLVFSSALRLGDRRLIQQLLEDQNFQLLLKVLSWNTFNKQKFDYNKQYQKLINFNNTLNIQCKKILQPYQQNAKLKFLKDIAACTILDFENQRIMSNITNINNQSILFNISNSKEIVEGIVRLAGCDAVGFVGVVVELWEIFRAVNVNDGGYLQVDYENKEIKEDFVAVMMEKQVHCLLVKAVETIISSKQLSQSITDRFHQKWIQSFNPLLSYNWQQSQQWICSKKQGQSLLHILSKLVTQTKNEGITQTILNFVRNLIQPTDNRIVSIPKFRCFVYNEFISKVWQSIKDNSAIVEIYIDFILRIYKVDYVRTRRILIQNKILHYFNNFNNRKSMVICAIKILDNFMQGENLDVFIYLRNHTLFKGLRQEYLRNASCQNIINSCFKSLLKKIKSCHSEQVRKYFQLIFLFKQNNHTS